MPNQRSVHAPHKFSARFLPGPLTFHTGIAVTFARLVPCGAEPRPSDRIDILAAAPNIFVRPVALARGLPRRRAARAEANSWPPRTLSPAVAGCAVPGDDVPVLFSRPGCSQVSSPDAPAGRPGPAPGRGGEPLGATEPLAHEPRHGNGTNAVWNDRERARPPRRAQKRRLP